mmetsp:Transcript_8283/g.31149  ORF Transcript_8283/g.31149 Transcript_8283/m.31149 type:complete len:297 (-) Transcript_8283:2950-3840(-)
MATSGCCCVQCISTGEIGIKERNGRFAGLMHPGPSWVCCPFDYVAGRVSVRVQALDVNCETKTKDNVFVNVVVSVQYQVISEGVYEAFYKLSDADEQITAYVYDVIRSTIPRLDLDDAFESKEQVATDVRESLEEVMQKYGYRIIQTLVTDLTPDMRVKDAMNRINESKRLKEAAAEKAEADKILQVKAAEADAEAKYLSGTGVARQRKAIVDGLRDSILVFADNVEGTQPRDVMDLLLLTQYFDMLKEVGSNPGTATVFLPNGGSDLQSQVRNGLLQANSANKSSTGVLTGAIRR